MRGCPQTPSGLAEGTQPLLLIMNGKRQNPKLTTKTGSKRQIIRPYKS